MDNTRKALQAILKAKDDDKEFIVITIEDNTARVIAESTTKSMLTSSICVAVKSAAAMHMTLYKLLDLIADVYDEELRNEKDM